jgi:ankyrin repeat protein
MSGLAGEATSQGLEGGLKMSDPTGHLAALFELAAADETVAVLAALPTGVPLHQLRNANGESLIQYCAYRRRPATLAALLAREPPLTLHEAATLGRADRIADVLAASPWAIDTLSPDGWTALHLAAHFGHATTLAALLASGADANLYSRAFERNLPLHAACAGGKVECALRLLPATRDIDARQGGGWTALMLAAEDGLLPVVAAMLARRADRALVNDKGKTALALAQERERSAVAHLLEEWK